jgi:hypothetical protein
MAQLHTPARGMVACVTSLSACAAPVLPLAGSMPSLAPGVLCGMCVAVARSGGGDGVNAVEAEAPGRLSAHCVTSMALRVHTASEAGAGGLASLPAVCAQVAAARLPCLTVCHLEALRVQTARRAVAGRLKSLPASGAEVAQL